MTKISMISFKSLILFALVGAAFSEWDDALCRPKKYPDGPMGETCACYKLYTRSDGTSYYDLCDDHPHPVNAICYGGEDGTEAVASCCPNGVFTDGSEPTTFESPGSGYGGSHYGSGRGSGYGGSHYGSGSFGPTTGGNCEAVPNEDDLIPYEDRSTYGDRNKGTRILFEDSLDVADIISASPQPMSSAALLTSSLIATAVLFLGCN